MEAEIHRIEHISDWTPVADIPSAYSQPWKQLNESYGTFGVYQVSLVENLEDIDKDVLIHSEICYTGYSKDIHTRTYQIRQPSGTHGASRYIRQNGLCRNEEVFIRYIYCSTDEDARNLESFIHAESNKKFGYRFKWVDASAGNDGTASMILDQTRKLSAEEIISIIAEMKDIARTNAIEEFNKKLSEV